MKNLILIHSYLYKMIVVWYSMVRALRLPVFAYNVTDIFQLQCFQQILYCCQSQRHSCARTWGDKREWLLTLAYIRCSVQHYPCWKYEFQLQKVFLAIQTFCSIFVLHLCKKHLTAGFPLLCVTFTMTNLTKFFAIDVCNSHLQKSITRQQIQKQIQSHHD